MRRKVKTSDGTILIETSGHREWLRLIRDADKGSRVWPMVKDHRIFQHPEEYGATLMAPVE